MSETSERVTGRELWDALSKAQDDNSGVPTWDELPARTRMYWGRRAMSYTREELVAISAKG